LWVEGGGRRRGRLLRLGRPRQQQARHNARSRGPLDEPQPNLLYSIPNHLVYNWS
jgi:hypothetical protein